MRGLTGTSPPICRECLGLRLLAVTGDMPKSTAIMTWPLLRGHGGLVAGLPSMPCLAAINALHVTALPGWHVGSLAASLPAIAATLPAALEPTFPATLTSALTLSFPAVTDDGENCVVRHR